MNTVTLNTSPFVNKWNTPDGHSPLVNYINKLYQINEEAIAYIDKSSFRYEIKKGRHLIKEGEFCNHVYFVKKGVLRGYVKEGAKEITTWIMGENNLVTSVRGFYLEAASVKNIQALEDCELIAAHYDDLQYLYDHYIEMNIAGRKILEQYYSDAEERAFISRLPKAASKYSRFLATSGELANRIQLKYIASYLGITIETLSRIRSKLINNK